MADSQDLGICSLYKKREDMNCDNYCGRVLQDFSHPRMKGCTTFLQDIVPMLRYYRQLVLIWLQEGPSPSLRMMLGEDKEYRMDDISLRQYNQTGSELGFGRDERPKKLICVECVIRVALNFFVVCPTTG